MTGVRPLNKWRLSRHVLDERREPLRSPGSIVAEISENPLGREI